MMLSVLFKALFLMVAAEPGIATFKSMVRLYRQYKNKKISNVKQVVRQMTISGIGLLVIFAIYVFIVQAFL